MSATSSLTINSKEFLIKNDTNFDNTISIEFSVNTTGATVFTQHSLNVPTTTIIIDTIINNSTNTGDIEVYINDASGTAVATLPADTKTIILATDVTSIICKGADTDKVNLTYSTDHLQDVDTLVQ